MPPFTYQNQIVCNKIDLGKLAWSSRVGNILALRMPETLQNWFGEWLMLVVNFMLLRLRMKVVPHWQTLHTGTNFKIELNQIINVL